MTKRLVRWCGLAMLLALVGCGQEPQGAMTPGTDTQASMGASDPYMAAGWEPGDEASWQAQMRKRAQSQNEYLRMAGQSGH